MDESANRPRKIAIIGGGISGLAAAHRVTELAPHAEVTLFEAVRSIGGHSTHRAARWLSDRTKRRQLHHQCTGGDRSLPADRFCRSIDSDEPGKPRRDGGGPRKIGARAGGICVDGAGANRAGASLADFKPARQSCDFCGSSLLRHENRTRMKVSRHSPAGDMATKFSSALCNRWSAAFTPPIRKS